jgi:hypothetical protein
MLLGIFMPAFYRGILLARAAVLVVHIGLIQGVLWLIRKIRR